MGTKLTVENGGKIALPKRALAALGVTAGGLLLCEIGEELITLKNADKAPF